MADLDHVVMAVEMHAIAGAVFQPCDQVPARKGIRISRRSMRADHQGGKPGQFQPRRKVVADGAIVLAWRIQGGDTDQVLGQTNKRWATGRDLGKDGAIGHPGRVPRGCLRGNVF